MKKILFIFVCMATFWVAMSFKPTSGEKYPLTLKFHHFVGNQILQMDTINYKNELGQAFTITKFRYYISNIKLIKTDGTEVSYNNYFLVNEEEPESKIIELKDVPSGKYTSIEMMIGVDSLHNCSGAQTGALDPINAMFWAWNTGYIFLKLEGKSAFSQSPGHIFEYHIGGYKSPYNCIRTFHIAFEDILIVDGAKELNFKANILELLKNPTVIDFSKLSSVTDFHNATTIADNYRDMFTIIKSK